MFTDIAKNTKTFDKYLQIALPVSFSFLRSLPPSAAAHHLHLSSLPLVLSLSLSLSLSPISPLFPVCLLNASPLLRGGGVSPSTGDPRGPGVSERSAGGRPHPGGEQHGHAPRHAPGGGPRAARQQAGDPHDGPPRPLPARHGGRVGGPRYTPHRRRFVFAKVQCGC